MANQPKMTGFDPSTGIGRYVTQWRLLSDADVAQVRRIASATFFACEDVEILTQGRDPATWLFDAASRELERRQGTDAQATEAEALAVPSFDARQIVEYLLAQDAVLRNTCINSLADAVLQDTNRTMLCRVSAILRDKST